MKAAPRDAPGVVQSADGSFSPVYRDAMLPEGEGRETIMPTYVSLVNWTDQGAKNVKDTVARLDRGSKSRGSTG